ncbi:hypothetical protein HDC37_001762 [Microbacterium sp. AK009]|uniref:hypothetical protein n=1 Tax=Microbacterium sp. AK009 TaxID=2723068 RepID=UPI0017D6F192|nr:hypothetical protein [Microbacterium sp. AK009]NYF16937.1 hypothetical protein [Microbacterium sp. AK009]
MDRAVRDTREASASGRGIRAVEGAIDEREVRAEKLGEIRVAAGELGEELEEREMVDRLSAEVAGSVTRVKPDARRSSTSANGSRRSFSRETAPAPISSKTAR